MKHSVFAAALAGIALVSLPAASQAQLITPKPVQFGVAAGAVIPSGDLGQGLNTGFNGTVLVGLRPSMIPLGIRLEGAYNRMGADGGGGNLHIISATGNFVYRFPSTSVSPYAIGGAGWCQVGITVDGFGTVTDNKFCWNAGGGIEMALSGFQTFVEARYNRVQADNGTAAYIPIVFGVMF